MQTTVQMCVFGAPADQDGVCAEHGESACVVTAEVKAEPAVAATVVPPQRDSRSSFKRARSLVFARRIAVAINGAATAEKPDGSPRFRSVI